MSIEPVTAARLRELLHYDPSTGVFTWLPRPISARTARRRKAGTTGRDGKVAGWDRPDGYREIMIGGCSYKSHRLAFLWMLGEWPAEDVDHINGDQADNRWSNLRAATTSQNIANSRCRLHNACGFKGVYWRSGKWRANIRIKGKLISLGYFDTLAAAALSYSYAACALFGEFAQPKWRDLLGQMRGVRCP